MVGAFHAIMRKKKNLTKDRRVQKQVKKMNKGTTAREVVEKINATLVPAEQLVEEATEKKRATLLLKNEPHIEKMKPKIVEAIRPGKIGPNGVVSLPTKINKKKVKKMLQRKRLLAFEKAVVQMEL